MLSAVATARLPLHARLLESIASWSDGIFFRRMALARAQLFNRGSSGQLEHSTEAARWKTMPSTLLHSTLLDYSSLCREISWKQSIGSIAIIAVVAVVGGVAGVAVVAAAVEAFHVTITSSPSGDPTYRSPPGDPY